MPFSFFFHRKQKGAKPCAMISMPLEMDVMILERTAVENLKNISRVKKSWRAYTTKNIDRMRLISADFITIESQPRAFLCQQQDTHHTMKKIIKAPSYLLFGTKQISIRDISSMNEDERNQLEMIPTWWIKPIQKVICHVGDDVFPVKFVSRINHLACLKINVSNYDNLLNLLEIAPKIDTLQIHSNDIVLDDRFLEVLWKRSWTNPEEFPTIKGETRFSIAKIIEYLKMNIFTRAQEHVIEISFVEGRLVDWMRWLNNINLPHFVTGNSEFTFRFRDNNFTVCINSFTPE